MTNQKKVPAGDERKRNSSVAITQKKSTEESSFSPAC